MSAVRFTVTKAEDESPIGESTTDGPNYGTTAQGDDVPQVRIVDTDGKFDSSNNVNQGENKMSKESDQLMDAPDGDVESGDKHMALYEDEFTRRPMISRFLSNMANYEGGIAPNVEQIKEEEEAGKKKAKASKLGTLLGVYFPCLQNIFGVILFIRLVWLVGHAGIIESFLIVFICSFTTLLTAISMSAIATNGVIPSGGSYFMISRALGPEFGGAVGILFYLGTSFASAMYIVGAVEILLKYIAPQIILFNGDFLNTYRIYGTVLLLLMVFCVFIGVKFVSKFAPIALACVIVSILAIYVGIFVANTGRGPRPCFVGDRIINSQVITLADGSTWCTKNSSGPLYQLYCGATNDSDTSDCDYFMKSAVETKPGIPGLASGVITKNYLNEYLESGDRSDGKRDSDGIREKGDPSKGEIVSDITTSFVVLLAIFFPSCTGIMAGSNRSGDLADAQKSIPVGTIMAIFTTGFVYLSSVVFFGATVDGQLLRDKYGESIGKGLVVANLAWPNPWVILIGSFLSTVGAGLQSLTGAPRLLQAISSDGVIPFMNVFASTTKSGEPLRALLLTAFFSELGVIIANVDLIAPIVTQFFLLCYGFVNLACALQTLLRTPNWRPRFRFYHWTLSLFGVALCLALMFISSWYYALICLAIAGAVYKYIEYKGAEKEWGDGIRGLAMSAARFALLRLEEGPPHVKNFRPQVLILMKLDEDLQPKARKLFSFSSQLKAGKGLTLVASVLQGKYMDMFADSQAARQSLTKAMKREKVKGFAEVLVSESMVDGLAHTIQTAGVGGLRHNTVIVGWPQNWRKKANEEKPFKAFIETIRQASYGHLAVLIPKGIEQYPENSEKMAGTIDIWWIVHDGGLLMLLPFLLTQHKVWRNCKMRIFTVAQMEDNSIQMKKDLQTFLYHLRFSAEVAVVELPDSDISAYTYERTLMMEQRTEMLKEIRTKQRGADDILPDQPQMIVDQAKKKGSTPTSPTSPQSPTSPTTPPPTSPTQLSVTVDTITEEVEDEETTEKKSIPNSLSVEQKISESNQYTFTPSRPKADAAFKKNLLEIKPDNKNVRRMHTAVRLNEVIVEKSHDAKLVILNLPGPPNNEAGEENYMEYLEVLTEGLERVLMVRGGGREVITMYS